MNQLRNIIGRLQSACHLWNMKGGVQVKSLGNPKGPNNRRKRPLRIISAKDRAKTAASFQNPGPLIIQNGRTCFIVKAGKSEAVN